MSTQEIYRTPYPGETTSTRFLSMSTQEIYRIPSPGGYESNMKVFRSYILIRKMWSTFKSKYVYTGNLPHSIPSTRSLLMSTKEIYRTPYHLPFSTQEIYCTPYILYIYPISTTGDLLHPISTAYLPQIYHRRPTAPHLQAGLHLPDPGADAGPDVVRHSAGARCQHRG